MNRSDAISRLLRRGTPVITKRNVRFSNINAAKEVWWLEVPTERLSEREAVSLLLYDDKSDILYVLQVPFSFLSENRQRLATRPEKACITLELSAERAKMFRDVRPGGDRVEFGRFLTDTIPAFSAGVTGRSPIQPVAQAPVLRKQSIPERPPSASPSPNTLSVDDLADLRRRLMGLLNALDSTGGTQTEGIRKRINRLSHDGGPIPREIAALMTTITEMRNSAEYESKILSASECAVVRHAWQAIQEWADSARRRIG